jgi:hypothetical protein
MVTLILILLFSCSYFFGYVMMHPGMSYWYPVVYTTVIFIGMCLPSAIEQIYLRMPDAKHSRGRRHNNRRGSVAAL